jgi:hypothetical protein
MIAPRRSRPSVPIYGARLATHHCAVRTCPSPRRRHMIDLPTTPVRFKVLGRGERDRSVGHDCAQRSGSAARLKSSVGLTTWGHRTHALCPSCACQRQVDRIRQTGRVSTTAGRMFTIRVTRLQRDNLAATPTRYVGKGCRVANWARQSDGYLDERSVLETTLTLSSRSIGM